MNSYVNVWVHLVLATWNREPLITPLMQDALYACLAAQCR